MTAGWQWDETLFAGTAAFYRRGRLPYAPGTAEVIVNVLTAGRTSRLLDVGCGPGTIGVSLAPFFGEVVGIDPDPGMIAEAELWADGAGLADRTRWLRMRAEDLPAGLGRFDVVTFGQSFHWMDRDIVPAAVHAMLRPGGALVHIAEWRNELRTVEGLPHPAAPAVAIEKLVRQYLGPLRRAGQGTLPHGTPGDEVAVLARAGFEGPDQHIVRGGQQLVRTEDDIVAWTFSLSSAAPHLFGEQRDAFEAELRRLLREESPSGLFSERQPSTEVRIWYTEED
ncbi:MAG: methyltransferase domain-containing protein [Catenulispora sp.]|nr:methyltransferase domain-containing protein [Catenulispora sp.]